MGMFDSVIAHCPNCIAEIEFQSKAGACVLRRYSILSVPAEIAASLLGRAQTCDCGEIVMLGTRRPIERVEMAVNPPLDWD